MNRQVSLLGVIGVVGLFYFANRAGGFRNLLHKVSDPVLNQLTGPVQVVGSQSQHNSGFGPSADGQFHSRPLFQRWGTGKNQ